MNTNPDNSSGRICRAFSGATNLLAIGPNTGTMSKVPARRLHADGALTVTGVDLVNVNLPDYGVGYVWDLQVNAIVSGSGIAVW